MAGAGRGKERRVWTPILQEEEGKGDILRSNCHFSHFFLLIPPPLHASFLLQAPAPSNRTERHEVPLGGRSHPSQLGRVAFNCGQSHHQRFQYDRESWYWDVHPVCHIQWLGVRCMIRRGKNTKREIFTGKMDLRGRKKKTYEISRMKKGPIDINIKIKRDKSTSFFFFLSKSAFKGPTSPPPLHIPTPPPPLLLDYLHDVFLFFYFVIRENNLNARLSIRNFDQRE